MAYADVVLADGPTAYWRFGEASGATTAVDAAGANDGTYTNTPKLDRPGALTDDDDGSVAFRSSESEYVTVPDHADLDLGDGPFSIEFWVKMRVFGTITHLLGKGATGGDAYNVLVASDNTVWCKNHAGGSLVWATSRVISDAAWHHIVLTKNGATRVAYFDGAAGTQTGTNVTLGNSTNQLVIGSYDAGSFEDLALDELAVYKSVLTAQKVLDHYLAGVRPLPRPDYRQFPKSLVRVA